MPVYLVGGAKPVLYGEPSVMFLAWRDPHIILLIALVKVF